MDYLSFCYLSFFCFSRRSRRTVLCSYTSSVAFLTRIHASCVLAAMVLNTMGVWSYITPAAWLLMQPVVSTDDDGRCRKKMAACRLLLLGATRWVRTIGIPSTDGLHYFHLSLSLSLSVRFGTVSGLDTGHVKVKRFTPTRRLCLVLL